VGFVSTIRRGFNIHTVPIHCIEVILVFTVLPITVGDLVFCYSKW